MGNKQDTNGNFFSCIASFGAGSRPNYQGHVLHADMAYRFGCCPRQRFFIPHRPWSSGVEFWGGMNFGGGIFASNPLRGRFEGRYGGFITRFDIQPCGISMRWLQIFYRNFNDRNTCRFMGQEVLEKRRQFRCAAARVSPLRPRVFHAGY